MKWPLIACLLLPGILVYLGLHIVRRGVIFVDLALAQVAALGTAWCLVLGHEAHDFHTYLYSVAFTLVGAGIFAMTRNSHHHRVPQEALIGIVYVVAAAAGMLLLSRSAEGNEELKKTLIGDVLLVQPAQVLKTFGLFAAIGAIHFIFRRRFLALSFEPERAERDGIAVRWWDFLFYALFGLMVTSFLQIGGVLLVFSYLIVPAVCANFLAQRLGILLLIGWVVATLSSVVGLYASYRFDLPTGAAIVCALGLALVIVAAIAKLRGPGISVKPSETRK
ncbi:MAG TPA: iron chelate uptake ABC transporter family permease subunit [Roseimicrobium sp.]|nr:iron chelate uptake ABC transporter family permease subunit [Roseimicrobium sp.]